MEQIEEKYAGTIGQLDKLVSDQVVPGISYCLFDKKEEYSRVFGHAQLIPQKKELKERMQYDVASLTKVIGTVPVICMAIQEGKLKLEDPISKYLPGVQLVGPTIRNLLTHTSGIYGYIPHRNDLNAVQLKEAYLNKQVVGPNLSKQIKYEDVNFLYLGWIAEKVYGAPIQQLITEKIIESLHLNETTFTPSKSRCVPTEVQKKRGVIQGAAHDPKAYILGAECGCAGLFTTLDDLISYCRSLIETNLADLLTPTMVEMLFQDQTPMKGQHSRSLGWKLLHAPADGHVLISHTGFTGTWVILDRKGDQGLVVLTNRVHPTAKNQLFLDRRDQIYSLYLKELEKIL
ncbi:serine hydrolase domain-containing protein [Lactobacillaceae bacterium 24-114]